jgi:DNA-binding protein H-NS
MATKKRTTYLGLKKQIAQLEAQAESLRKSEVADVVAKIKEGRPQV